MSKLHHELLCRECGMPWVNEDGNGWSKPCRDCPYVDPFSKWANAGESQSKNHDDGRIVLVEDTQVLVMASYIANLHNRIRDQNRQIAELHFKTINHE